MSGIARIYNSIGHFYFYGELRKSQHSEIRVQVGPPNPGSVFYLLYMLLLHGKMAVLPELLFELAKLAVPNFVKAIVAKKTGQGAQLDKALDIIAQQTANYHELIRVQQDNDMRTREQLMGFVQHLAIQNRQPMADMAAPVGRTVKELRQIPAKAEPLVVDEPVAESLRSPEELTVGDVREFRATFVALNTKTGACVLEETDTGRELRGKITDPVLVVPHNVYSQALDVKQPVTLIAKPTLRENGEVHKLFISDAKHEE